MRILLLLFLLLPSVAFGLNPEYREGMKHQLYIIIDRHPFYKWGESSEESKGLDCSGFLFLAARRTGIPVLRRNALQMRNGEGGWTGKDTDIDHMDELDIIWWTWPGSGFTRPHGHVGILLRTRDTCKLWVTHSCQSAGVTHQEIKGPLFRDISALRKLTIGNKTEPKLGPGVIQTK